MELDQIDTDIYTVYCMIYSHSNVLHCCELHFTLVHIKATACASDSIGIRGISLCVNFSAFHFLQHLHISCCTLFCTTFMHFTDSAVALDEISLCTNF